MPAGQNTLLRFLNASLKTHVPTINGQYWKMIAEDGNPYPYLSNPRQQYTAFLAAGKTMDVMLTPTMPASARRYAIFDSRQFDTNNGAQGGGLLAYLDVTPAHRRGGTGIRQHAGDHRHGGGGLFLHRPRHRPEWRHGELFAEPTGAWRE